ncbi:ATPase [Streptococcus suis]|uniref:ATPase n=1 Tax=Streptococcus suis TaxID=1307 RepID=A0A4T2GRG8_STRSU|nr:ATPase [Streptococcus suis]MBM7269143.1 ATPase [Streptococcus suis]TII01177.1 ATPase [Streptococcus suis]
MEVEIKQAENQYILRLNYEVQASPSDSWDLLATNQGLEKWFPQLRVETDHLVFEMEDFREVMPLLSYQPESHLAYEWDRAQVSFHIKNQQIIFEEIIPFDFGNEFADAKKDMTGWLVQNDCIMALLNAKKLPDRAALREKWSAYLEKELNI